MSSADAGRAVVTLGTAAVLAYFSYSLCRSPLLPLFARDLGAGPALVGLVVGASTLTGVLLKMPAGACSDVVGRRPLLLVGACVFAGMPITYLGVATIGGLLAARFVHGSATAIFGPVASAAVSDLAPRAHRGAWLGLYSTAQGAGQALAPLVAGALLSNRGYGAVFLTSAVCALSVPFLVARVREPRPVAPGLPAPRWHTMLGGAREMLRHRLVLAASGAQAAQFVMNGALNGFLPLYAHEVLGVSMSALGAVIATQTLTTLLVRPVIGSVSDAIGRRRVIALGLLTCSAAMWAVPMVPGAWSLTVALTVYAVGVATTSAAATAFVTDVSRREHYGAAHGVFGTIYDIGDAVGPIGAGFVVAAVGYPWMFQGLSAIGLGATVAFLWASRQDGPRGNGLQAGPVRT